MLAEISLSFLSGAVCGALFLCVGLFVGIYLGRRAQSTETGRLNSQQMMQVLAALNRWATHFATDVHQHRKTIDSLAERARRVDAPHQPAAAQAILDQAQEANSLLERRLAAAEKNLREQSLQLESYMAEARTDGLTKLPNRRALDDELAARVTRWRREGKAFAILMIDVDHFKKLNDVHGHLAGDLVLQRVGEVLKQTELASFAGRYGGEEFCVLLAGGTIDSVREFAAQLRTAVERSEIVYEGQLLSVTISCGGAQTQMGDDAASLVARADEALYAAKQAGRNRSHWHDGRQILLLENGAIASASKAPTEEAPPSGFENVISDLQKKLHEVASQ